MREPRIRLLRDLAAANLGADRPFRVILMLTGRCPHRCRVCGVWKTPPPPDPTLDELERFFRANRFSWVNLTGGEIVLREDLPAVMGLLGSGPVRPAVVTFPTTGHRPEAAVKAVHAALAAGIPRLYVTVSFDGPPAVHDALRGREGAFQRAAETFRRLRDVERIHARRFRVIPGLTLSAPLLERRADPAAALAAELGLAGPEGIHLNLAHTSSHYYSNRDDENLRPPPGAVIPLLARYGRAARQHPGAVGFLEGTYRAGAVRYLAYGTPPLPCRAARASLFVDAGWQAWPCTVFDRPLGDLRAHGFRVSALKASGALASAVRAIERGACPGCWTPCEAFTSILCSLLRPGLFRLLAGRSVRPPLPGHLPCSRQGRRPSMEEVEA